MSTITKEVKCITCGSYIHKTERCYIWRNTIFCRTNYTWNRECNCVKCVNRCQYCNDYLNNDGLCNLNHNDERCTECNEFLMDGKCCWNHTESLCQFCNLPIKEFNGLCINYHRIDNEICSECDMPLITCHMHDGIKCKVCNSLLNRGKCIYGCIGGSDICIHCNFGGLYNNKCLNCNEDNTGQFTKRAIK